MTILHLIIQSTWYLLRQVGRLQTVGQMRSCCHLFLLIPQAKRGSNKEYIVLHVHILWDPVAESSIPLDTVYGDTEHRVHHKVARKGSMALHRKYAAPGLEAWATEPGHQCPTLWSLIYAPCASTLCFLHSTGWLQDAGEWASVQYVPGSHSLLWGTHPKYYDKCCLW